MVITELSPQTDQIFPASLERTLIQTPVPGSSAPLQSRVVYQYNPLTDELELMKNLRIPDHLSPQLQTRCKNFVIKFFDRFREEGVSEPIIGYELIIDTGNHPPICVKQPQYGIHKSFIMDKHIFLFIQKLWIIQDRSSPWAAKISLAPKPHQEHIFSMKDYEWRF